MHYRIDASLQNGRPRLRILDADSHCLRLAWQPADARVQDESDLQDLFRRLLLITTMDELLENSHHPGEP